MNRESFLAEVMGIEVVDTHAHLVGDSLCAKDFWKIGEYRWLMVELQASGYPRNPELLPEEKRIEAYARAFNATRNTSMNWVVREIFRNLYGIEIKDEKSIRLADEAVRSTALQQDWAEKVAERLFIRKVVVNWGEHTNFRNLPDTCVFIPRVDGMLDQWIRKAHETKDQIKAVTAAVGEIDVLLNTYSQKGCKGIMTTLRPFNLQTYGNGELLMSSGNSKDEITVCLLHALCRMAEKYGLFIQLFLGVENGWSSTAAPVNDPYRIVKLHGIFDQYHCKFELVAAAEVNTMDVVEAARLFPNVHAGGLWWFTFRPSVFLDSMQKRFEALPPSCSSLIVSDARCIEWCYGKILLIKRLLADYLYGRIQSGWIGKEDALYIAREWLYESAMVRYGLTK